MTNDKIEKKFKLTFTNVSISIVLLVVSGIGAATIRDKVNNAVSEVKEEMQDEKISDLQATCNTKADQITVDENHEKIMNGIISINETLIETNSKVSQLSIENKALLKFSKEARDLLGETKELQTDEYKYDYLPEIIDTIRIDSVCTYDYIDRQNNIEFLIGFTNFKL